MLKRKIIVLLWWLMGSGILHAQDTLSLLMKLDPGLPPSGLNGSRLGESANCLGDINGDGLDDWAALLRTAGDYESGEQIGKIYIWLGSASYQKNQVPEFILSEFPGLQSYSSSINGIGDVNNDQFDDFLVVARDRSYLCFGNAQAETFQKLILAPGEWPYSIAPAGDVNNDGYDDMIIGFRNKASVFLGGYAFDANPEITFHGEHERDNFGYHVTGAGDINGDGYDDLIVGASGYYKNGYDAGRAYVYFGNEQMDTLPDIVLNGEKAEICFGGSVSGAGDLNKDGYNDFMIGAYRYEHGGRLYIYYGGSNPDTLPDLTVISSSGGNPVEDINQDGYDDLLIKNAFYLGGASMDSLPDLAIPSAKRIIAWGDFNGDGFIDYLNGDWESDVNGYLSGCISMYNGGTQLPASPAAEFYGERGGMEFGMGVCGPGDLNSDGYDDFVISGRYSGYSPQEAFVSVYMGGKMLHPEPDFILYNNSSAVYAESICGAGDVNGDGYKDLLTGGMNDSVFLYLGSSSFDNEPDLQFTKQDSSKYFGSSIDCAGDVNKDGFDDILIGDFGNYSAGTQSGRAYIYYGGTTMDTKPDLVFKDGTARISFGATVKGVGDINNDGYDDVAIGAPRYDRINHFGRLYLYLGGPDMDGTPDLVITGTEQYYQFGSIIAAGGDINNDGYGDILVSTPYMGNGIGISSIMAFHGGSVMDTIPDVVIRKSGYGFGISITPLGDLNHDGFDDFMFGDTENKCVFVYYGGDPVDSLPDLVMPGMASDIDSYGSSIAYAGDINGDNTPDILVGDPMNDATGYCMGRVYIFSARKAGIIPQKESTQILLRTYPNPALDNTTFHYTLKQAGLVNLDIFNTFGQKIASLINMHQLPGTYEHLWNTGAYPAGIYLCRLQTPGLCSTIPLVILK
ncbi:MAG: FG-GAP-like repeat-containing protein [Bacteroidales bacterium]